VPRHHAAQCFVGHDARKHLPCPSIVRTRERLGRPDGAHGIRLCEFALEQLARVRITELREPTRRTAPQLMPRRHSIHDVGEHRPTTVVVGLSHRERRD
jgi:hypothetical protein